METKKWLPWVAIAGAAIVLYLYLQNSSGGGSSAGSTFASVTSAAPDTGASDAARYSFLASGIGALTQLEAIITNDQYQLAGLHDTNTAAVQAAEAQSKAGIASAKASTAGKHGLSLGPLTFNW